MYMLLKNTLRFTTIAALFTIFCLVGVRIIKDDNWLNIKRPTTGNGNNNFGLNFTPDNSLNNDLAYGNISNDDLAHGDNNDSTHSDSLNDDLTHSDNSNDTLTPDDSYSNESAGNSETKDGDTSPPSNNVTLPSNDNTSSNNENTLNNDNNKFIKVSPEYFDDALFIGDSRTVGLMEYGSIKNATFFASIGMDIYNIYSTKVNVGKQGKIDLMSLLKNNRYSKVYIMLGINELGYNFDCTIKKYSQLIDTIKSCQPGVIIYVEANMHVSESRSASDNIFNNTNINKFNHLLALLAESKNAYYLDVNPLFDDSNGNLRADYTYDNTHVLGKHYKTWTDWIAENAIAKPS